MNTKQTAIIVDIDDLSSAAFIHNGEWIEKDEKIFEK